MWDYLLMQLCNNNLSLWNWWMMWYFLFTCLILEWSLRSRATASLLSQYIRGGSKVRTPKLDKKNLLYQTASFEASEAATYFASVVESVVAFCFTLCQLTAPPASMKTKPDVEAESPGLTENLHLHNWSPK